MKSSKLLDLLKTGNIVIPIYLLKYYKDFALTMDEFVFIMYLYNQGNNVIFDPNKICDELNIKNSEVLTYISNLTDKKLINVETKKNDKGVIEEVISLDGFYSKISLLVMDKVNSKDVTDSDIYSTIEKEFGRTLSPMEYEIIKSWLSNNISEELIVEALREATFNGVSNLRYIDKILYEWGKLGIKNKDDVIKNKKKFNDNKNKEKVDLEGLDLDWNWFEDGED